MADQMTLDPHRERAAKLFNVRPEDVTPEQRRYAKGMASFARYTAFSNPQGAGHDFLRERFLIGSNAVAQMAAADVMMEELEQKMAAAGFAKIDVDAWEKLK